MKYILYYENDVLASRRYELSMLDFMAMLQRANQRFQTKLKTAKDTDEFTYKIYAQNPDEIPNEVLVAEFCRIHQQNILKNAPDTTNYQNRHLKSYAKQQGYLFEPLLQGDN